MLELSEAPSLSFESSSVEDLDEILASELTSIVPPAPDAQPFARIDLALVRFTPELLEAIPQEIAEQYKVLPVYLRKAKKKKKSSTPGLLYIAAADPEDQAALEDCSLCCNLQVRAFLADPQELREAIPIVYRGGSLARPGAPSSQATPPPPPSMLKGSAAPSESTPTPPHSAAPAQGSPASRGAPAAPPKEGPPVVKTSSSMPELPLIRPTGVGSAAPASTAPTATPTSELPTDPPPPPAPASTSPASIAPSQAGAPVSPGMDAAPAASGMDAAPSSTTKAPLLVVLGGDIGLADYCHEVVAPLGGHVESWEIGAASEKRPGAPPNLLLVAEELYIFDRRAFNLLAFRLGAPLVVWSQEMDPADLQAVLLAARCGPGQKPG